MIPRRVIAVISASVEDFWMEMKARVPSEMRQKCTRNAVLTHERTQYLYVGRVQELRGRRIDNYCVTTLAARKSGAEELIFEAQLAIQINPRTVGTCAAGRQVQEPE